MANVALTTLDNPYDPFTQWEDWLAYDEGMGYHSSALLARIVKSSDELSQADQDFAIETAIDEILEENILGIYRKVKKET